MEDVMSQPLVSIMEHQALLIGKNLRCSTNVGGIMVLLYNVSVYHPLTDRIFGYH